MRLISYWRPWLVAAAIIVAIWAAYAYQVKALDQRSQVIATERADQLAASYQGDVSLLLGLADNFLKFASIIDARFGPATTARIIEQRRMASGVVANIAIVDAAGNGFSVNDGRLTPIALGKSTTMLRAARTSAIVVGTPLVGHLTKVLSLPLVRDVRNLRGARLGSVSALLDVKAFAFGYGAKDLGAHGVLEMVGLDDLIIRARLAGDDAKSFVGRQFAGTPAWRNVITAGSGNYWFVSTLDHERRVFAYRKIPGQPLVALAGLASDDIFAQTSGIRQSALWIAGAATAVTLILLGAWLLQEKNRRELRASQQHEVIAKNDALAAQAQALAASRAKSDFLATMSHEIRNPMNGVVGLTHLALLTELSDEQHGLLEKIDYSAKSLLTIINDILDFSKIEAGKLELEHVRFNVRDVLTGICGICGVNAQQKGLYFETQVDPGVPQLLIGDPGRFGQVVLNLASNAIKFTASGTISVAIRSRDIGDGQIELVTTVHDTGIGMDDGDQSRLFQAFSQADGSIARRFGGTGLGLAISKALVGLMGGSISVQSALGAGSTFQFSIVAARALDLRSGNRSTDAKPDESLSGARVLVADDNAINRHIMERLLARLGIIVDTAENGAVAVEKVLSGAVRYDAILMDIEMPELDGLGATRLIREAPLERQPPIIAMTAHAMEQERRICLDSGMNDHLGKPIDPKLLAQQLRRCLRRTADQAAPL